MSGTRRFNDPAAATVKLTVAIPVDLDRQLRALAARQGIGVSPMIREWVLEKLRAAPETEPAS
jgi:hypothetical protein